jgi:nitric oxide reductase subunit B
MRGLVREDGWSDGSLKVSFWGTNIGLFIIFIGTLLPIGILQVLDNIKYGFWHARSDEFWFQDTIQLLGQIRALPDLLIILGAGSILLFMVKAITRLKQAEVKSGERFD